METNKNFADASFALGNILMGNRLLVMLYNKVRVVNNN